MIEMEKKRTRSLTSRMSESLSQNPKKKNRGRNSDETEMFTAEDVQLKGDVVPEDRTDADNEFFEDKDEDEKEEDEEDEDDDRYKVMDESSVSSKNKEEVEDEKEEYDEDNKDVNVSSLGESSGGFLPEEKKETQESLSLSFSLRPTKEIRSLEVEDEKEDYDEDNKDDGEKRTYQKDISEDNVNVAKLILELKDDEADIEAMHKSFRGEKDDKEEGEEKEELEDEERARGVVERIENNQEMERVGKEDEVKEEKGEKEGGGVCEKKDERIEQEQIEERLLKLEIEMLKGVMEQYEEELEEMKKKNEQQLKELKELERENKRMKEEKIEWEREINFEKEMDQRIEMMEQHHKEREAHDKETQQLSKNYIADKLAELETKQGHLQHQHQQQIQQREQIEQQKITQQQEQQLQQQQQQIQQLVQQEILQQQEQQQRIQRQQQQQEQHKKQQQQVKQQKQQQVEQQKQMQQQQEQLQQELQQLKSSRLSIPSSSPSSPRNSTVLSIASTTPTSSTLNIPNLPLLSPTPYGYFSSSKGEKTEGAKKEFDWERHSSGVARKAIEKMGYKGKGLGKHEDGIEDAITVEDTTTKTKTKALIFSSSITRGIDPNGFNKKLKNSKARFHKFSGKKVHHIKDYMPTHIVEDRPDSVVIVAGGNDVPIGKFDSVPLTSIADDIMEAGLLCRRNGVRDIHISSILPRGSFYFQLRRHRLNLMLKEQCGTNGFIFVDNRNIVLSDHIGHDGVHLNKAGSSALCRNLCNSLNFLNSKP